MSVTVITASNKRHAYENGTRFQLNDGALAVCTSGGIVIGIYAAETWKNAYQDAEFKLSAGDTKD